MSVGQIGLQDEAIGGRKAALELGEQALMPDSIKRLFNIEEGHSEILFKLKGGCHSIHYSMALMDCGVVRAEAKLAIWNDILAFQDRIETSKEQFFSDLAHYRKEAWDDRNQGDVVQGS